MILKDSQIVFERESIHLEMISFINNRFSGPDQYLQLHAFLSGFLHDMARDHNVHQLQPEYVGKFNAIGDAAGSLAAALNAFNPGHALYGRELSLKWRNALQLKQATIEFTECIGVSGFICPINTISAGARQSLGRLGYQVEYSQ